MNSRFEKYLKELNKHQDQADIELTLNELHKSFATLTQSEQKYAELVEGHSFRDCINDFKENAENARLNAVVEALGVDQKLLISLINSKVDDKNLNSFGRFDALKESVDKDKAKKYFESLEHTTLLIFKVNMRIDKMLKDFVLSGGVEQ